MPLIQITAPSGAGVSRNQYQQFNVAPQGAILNNSRVATATQQAGYVDGNPNLANGKDELRCYIYGDLVRPLLEMGSYFDRWRIKLAYQSRGGSEFGLDDSLCLGYEH